MGSLQEASTSALIAKTALTALFADVSDGSRGKGRGFHPSPPNQPDYRTEKQQERALGGKGAQQLYVNPPERQSDSFLLHPNHIPQPDFLNQAASIKLQHQDAAKTTSVCIHPYHSSEDIR